MDVAAGVITLLTSACTLAHYLKQLVGNIRERDESAQSLEDKAETLAIALEQIRDAYGPETVLEPNSGEQLIRQTVERVAARCLKDLKRFNCELTRLSRTNNWAQAVWRQQFAAPAIVKIEKSIEGHLQSLNMLISLIQGRQLYQILDLLLTRNPAMVMPPSVEVGDQVAESDLILSEIATLFRAEDPEDGGNTVSVVKGIQLLQAIKNGDIYTFESLLIQSDTSLRERDGKKRTPLLLAASLGKGVMVKMLLAEYADARSRASSDLHTWQQSFIGNAISSQWETDDHRTIDLSTADKLGRTTLHYCAEFEMYDEAKFLLDHDVDANARDNCGYPPVYYAVKNRKYYATKLLSARTTVFRLPPTPTSNEITKVLEETSRNRRLGPMSNLEVPRHNSVSVLPRDSGRFSPLPQRRRSN